MKNAGDTVPYCKECGKELVRGAKFCSNCGNSVSTKAVRTLKKPEARPTTSNPIWRILVIVGVIAVVVVAATVALVGYLETSGGGGGGGGTQPIFTTIKDIMQNPNAYLNQEVLVNGTVLAGGSSGMASDGGSTIDLTFSSSLFPYGFLALNSTYSIAGRVVYLNELGYTHWAIEVSSISKIS